MTMLSKWRPHRWSQSWSLMASNAASTMRRFCSTLIPSSTPLLCIVSGVFRLDERKRDRRPVKDPEPAGAYGEEPHSAGGLTRRHPKPLGSGDLATLRRRVNEFLAALEGLGPLDEVG